MLHETLRELVTTRGAGVLRDADELRGALDDFLAEDEATTGEVNVLVDAVRLGALPRLLTLLDGGAAPDAAISEVGDGLARDRGADDVRRPRWALAVLAYALGRIDGSAHLAATPPGTIDIHRVTQPLPDVFSAPAAAPPPPPPPPPPPADQGAPVGSALPPPPPVIEPVPEPAPAVPPVSPEERKRSRGALAMLLVLLLVAGAGAVGAWWWLNRDGEETSADDNTSETPSPSDEPTKGKGKKDKPLTGKLPDNELVTSLLVGDQELLYRVDTETGEAKPISKSPATLPTITPDRRSVIYLVPTASGGRQLRIVDLVDETDEPLFPAGSPCEYGNRPAFSPNGLRFVLTCADSSGAGTGLYTASIGGEPTQISDLSVGAPTWGSDGFIYFFTGKEFVDSAISRIGEAGGDPAQVTDPDSGFTYADPDWSDTGLLYLRLGERPEEGTPEGEIAYIDSTGTEQVVEIGETVGHPAWSADGQAVVFLVDDSAGNERVGIASLDDPSAWRPLDITVDGDKVDGNPTAPAWGTR